MEHKGNITQTQVKMIEKSKRYYIFKENFELTLLALPAIVLFFLFKYLPMFGIVIAFKQFDPNKGIWGSKWIGLENFDFFFSSPDAFRVIRNTVLYSLDFMFVTLIFSVVLALLFYNLANRTALKVYNTIVILPKFLSMVLIAFIVYAMLKPVSGVFNKILDSVGLHTSIDWYAKPNVWPWILTIVNIWQSIGMGSIIYYASLMGIDEALFEASRLDGANKWQQTIYIAVPHLVPIMMIQTILAFGSLFNGDFGLFYQITRDVGTLYPTTDIINTYVFRGLMSGKMGISAAIGLIQSVVGLVMIIGVNKIVQKVSPENTLF